MAADDPTSSTSAKQPKEISVIFITEMWERFGFYLMVAVFVPYLITRLHLTDAAAAALYGYYGASVYFAPFLGGIVADKWLGYRKSVLFGAAFLSAGYAILAFVSTKITSIDNSLYAALLVIAIGNGLFKPNMSSLVGNLYPQGDPRRDAGFSIYYMAVNVGALLAPLVGFLAGRFGGQNEAPWAFGCAAAGMFLSFIYFAFQGHKLERANRKSSLSAVLHIALPKEYEDPKDPPHIERRRILSIFIISLIAIAFWAVFQQNATTLNIFALRNTDLTFGGLIPAEFFAAKEQDNSFAGVLLQSVNPFFIITLTFPVIAAFAFLKRRWKLAFTTPSKIALGLILTALSCIVMVFASLRGGNTGQVSPLWLIGSYFVVTIAELCLSPMGTSLVTKLAPKRMTSIMLGVWYFATAVGYWLAGKLGIYWQKWPHHQFFLLLTVGAVAAAGLLAVFLPFLNRSLPKEKETNA